MAVRRNLLKLWPSFYRRSEGAGRARPMGARVLPDEVKHLVSSCVPYSYACSHSSRPNLAKIDVQRLVPYALLFLLYVGIKGFWAKSEEIWCAQVGFVSLLEPKIKSLSCIVKRPGLKFNIYQRLVKIIMHNFNN